MGGKRILEQVSVSVPVGSTLAILGPSGCGKTTLLRVVAGLQVHDGDVTWQGTSVAGVAPHRRGFGLLFQGHALFPHLDVAGNVAYGLHMGSPRAPRSETDAAVHGLLAMVGLDARADSSIDTLSGGESRRVSLARALAPRPHLLMLDEPLSGLDRPLREQLLADIRRLLTELQQTALYVTHDLEEALAVADRVAVMGAGRIEQVAGAASIYHRPATEFVARFLGLTNILDLTPTPIADVYHTAIGKVRMPRGETGARALLHPAALRLAPVDAGPEPEPPLTGQFVATVGGVVRRGPYSVVRLQYDGDDPAAALTALVPPHVAAGLQSGARVRARFGEDALVALGTDRQ